MNGNKLKALFKSRRFWVAVAGVVAISANELAGISQEEVLTIAGIVIAWIIGDSVRRTD